MKVTFISSIQQYGRSYVHHEKTVKFIPYNLSSSLTLTLSDQIPLKLSPSVYASFTRALCFKLKAKYNKILNITEKTEVSKHLNCYSQHSLCSSPVLIVPSSPEYKVCEHDFQGTVNKRCMFAWSRLIFLRNILCHQLTSAH